MIDLTDSCFKGVKIRNQNWFGCQSTQLCLLEDWRKVLDNHKFAAAVLMDLSKAFDCLPHGLLIKKLRAYRLAPEAIDLLSSYLSDRVQHVRLGSHTSTWKKYFKGCTISFNPMVPSF